MFFSSQTLFMLHHKVWSSQIRTTLCEEHSKSPIRHRLKIPKPLCAFRYDRVIHFGHTEFTKLIKVFHLGATDLNFSVTSSCSNRLRFCISVPPSCFTRSHWQGQDIYTHGWDFGNFFKLLSPRVCPALPPQVSGSSPCRQRPPAAGFRRRQRNSAPPLSP